MAFWDREREGPRWGDDSDDRDRWSRDSWSGRDRDYDRPYDRGYGTDYGRRRTADSGRDFDRSFRGRESGTPMTPERDYGRYGRDRDFGRPMESGFDRSRRETGGYGYGARDYGRPEVRGERYGRGAYGMSREEMDRDRWRLNQGHFEDDDLEFDRDRDRGRESRRFGRDDYDRVDHGFANRTMSDWGRDERDERVDYDRSDRGHWYRDDWDRNRNRW